MNLKIRITLFLLIAIWVFGMFVQFFIPLQSELAYSYIFLDSIYSTLCHQEQEKLISINLHQTLVCGRCTGIYIGGFLSSFILLFISKINIKSGKAMVAASLPMLIDVVLYSSGLYTYNINIAFITGLFFGSVGIVYIYNGLQILLAKNGKFN